MPDAGLDVFLYSDAMDDLAWSDLVTQYQGLVQSVVREFRLGQAQGADVIQTTWLRLIEQRRTIREPERLAGWLRTTTRRACLEVLRRSSREHLVSEYREDKSASLQPPPFHDGPEEHALREERCEMVRRALDKLPERHQVLLRLLSASTPPSYEEIGRRLGMPVGSIGPTRARVLARVRADLEAEGLTDLAL